MARPRFSRLDLSTQQNILETAAVEFAARGFEGTSLNRLLGRLELSKGSFYYYFDDKADLFLTVADHAWKTILPADTMSLDALDADTFWPALEGLMQAARERVRENPWLIGITRLIYDPPDVDGVRAALAEKFEEARQWQAGLIRRGQNLGVVRQDLPVGLLQALVVGADEAGDRWLVNNWHHFDEDEVGKLFREIFAIFRRMLEGPCEETDSRGGRK